MGVCRIPTVCIDCRYLAERPSGIAQVVQALVDHIPRMAPDLHFLLLRNPARRTPLSAAPNVSEEIVRAPANGPATMWFLPENAPVRGVDLFHATFNIMPARLACPAVTTVHDIMWLTNPEWCDRSGLGRVRRLFFAHGIERALKHSARIAVVSEATRRAIASHAPRAAPRVRVTMSGVADRFRWTAPDPRLFARLGIGEGARFALVVGQFAPYKNHEGALRAFARALSGRPDALLVFVQRQGEALAPMLRLARQLDVADRVRFTGPVENAELIQLYSGAALLFHPSLCEGFGNPLAEAMACGCPVVTSDRGPMTEVTGGAARLVDPDDADDMARALLDVWDDRERADAMRKAGLAQAARLDWARFARANLEIYRELL